MIDQKVKKVFSKCPSPPLSAGSKQISQKLLLRGMTIIALSWERLHFWGMTSAKEYQIIKVPQFEKIILKLQL